jgi:hypothetical protein
MTDLEKLELSIRRLSEKLGKGIGTFQEANLLKRLADQIADDEKERSTRQADV